MPSLTRWMIKTSLVYLLLAFLVGLFQSLSPTLQSTSVGPLLARLEPVRVHLFVVGWLTLLIFGVVFWMFPKYSQEKPRGRERLGWTAYWLLNAGLALRVLGESTGQAGGMAGWGLVLAAILQWLGGAAFVLITWPRVKEK